MRIAALKFAPESKCPATSESRRQLVNKRHSRVRGFEAWYNFSIVQRNLLNPNDFSTVAVLKRDLIRFQERYEKSAKPFEWTFTRRDLHDLLAKLNTKSDHLAA